MVRTLENSSQINIFFFCKNLFPFRVFDNKLEYFPLEYWAMEYQIKESLSSFIGGGFKGSFRELIWLLGGGA